MPSPFGATRRILALRLLMPAIDRLRRQRPPCTGSADAPLVVVEKDKGLLRLAALSAEARAAGLRDRMALADARAIHPALTVVDADPAADAALLEAVADWCDRFTPLVALKAPDALTLDITGCAHLFGGESTLARTIRLRLRALGLNAAVAVAATEDAGHALTFVSLQTIVAAGAEAAALAPVPLGALTIDDSVLRGLQRAGLKTVGDALSRRRSELVARFGAPLIATLDRVMAQAQAPISPRRMLPAYVVERRFQEPVLTQDVVVIAIRRLAGTLGAMLEARGEGLRRMEASFFRTDGRVRRIVVETGRPARAPDGLARLFAERLDALADPLDPGFGFDLIRLAALHVEPFAEEMPTFGGQAEAEAVEALVDRLAARFGAHRVLRHQALDSHIPEDASRTIPAQWAADAGHGLTLATSSGWLVADPHEPPRRPLRLFAPPEPVEVVAEVPDGPPAHFRWRRVLHRIVAAEGPERIAMEWWKRGPAEVEKPTRDYFRVEDEEGRRFWLYRDGLHGIGETPPRWFLHGLFA